MGTVVIAVVLFMMIYLVPKMVGFIKNMGQELPLHTKILIATSNVFVNYWYLVIGLPAARRHRPGVPGPHQRRRPLSLRRVQAAPAAGRHHPAQDHPVALRRRVRHDVLVGHLHSRFAARHRGRGRQPGDPARPRAGRRNDRRGPEHHRRLPERRPVPAAGAAHAARRRKHRRPGHRADQRQLLLRPRRQGIDRAACRP